MTGKGTRRGEFELIAELFSPLSAGAPGALGLTDDAALVNVSPGCELVATVDTVIAGVHFRIDDPPDLVARKALRVNLSDLAAKGARPIGFLHALALNDATSDVFVEAYAKGLAADVKEFGVPLLGGDTTSGPGPLSITITAFGEVEKGRALLRRGARFGDALCVTGTIGDGALGLKAVPELNGRYQLPQPRLAAGQALVGLATACLDVSDGLVADVNHICKASRVCAVIASEHIPLSAAARAAVERDPTLWDVVLGGGDDYELAFTLAVDRLGELESLARRTGTSFTQIGLIGEGAGVNVLANGKPMTLSRPGFRHR